MITEDYVSFETAKLLKAKRADFDTDNVYTSMGRRWEVNMKKFNYGEYDVSGYVKRPTLQMAMKWLREVHKVDIAIYHELNDESTSVYYKYIGVMPGKTIFECKQGVVKYEQAVENAIKWVLENLI